ncbi:phage tail protein [Clostridium perfringens]|uniref:phage tail spike protein n=1 Tax=Clostridium perfringens TaxID=1502 RepID=UPI001CCC66B7|nr:phage tail spike protein [Clostridium perfringens]UBK43386.1 phage tail protein [Clostridium perfringens]
MELLQLYDKNKKKIAALTEYENLCIESILESGDKTLSFYYSLFYKFYDEIEEETYIRTKTDEYVVKAKGGDSNDNKTLFTCKLNVEELEGTIFDRFESVEQNLVDALNLAIVGTGWRLNSDNCNNRKKRTIRMTNCSSWTIIQKAKKLYDIEFKFDTLNKIIMLFDKIGDDRGIYFIDSLNLRALQVQGNSYGFYTRIIPTGKDGLTIASVNDGKTYLENKQYSNKTLTYYWKDERYTKPESLKEDALEKLNIMSKPFKSYIASTINLAKMNGKYKDILDYNLGDYIYLISKKNKVKDKHRIVKTKEYPQDHSKDTVELANKALDLSEEKLLVDEMSNTLENITTDNGTVDGSTIDSIQVKQIEDFKANVIQVTNLHSLNADIDYLKVNKADMQDVNIVKAKIGTLETTKANITELNSLKATLQQAIITKADITDLNSAVGKINVLESKTASIDNLLSQKASINDLNALNATISEALIKKATIAQLEALETKTNNLIADKANITDLNVINANINKVQTETANIKTLLNGNLSSENIQAGGITSDKLVIANGFIKDAMIDSISVNKLNAGIFTTDKFNIRSKDGNLIIKDNTIQIKDSSKVRVQIGKDASGDYSLYVWDKLGNLMFNALGITKDAIKDKIIRNDMVSDDAAIEGKKLNIESVIREVNNGKSNLKASKIDIDTKGQTLDIAFSNLVTENGKNKEEIVSLITKLNVQQGQISASIENSKVLEGKQKTLEDNYNRTVVTVDSLKNTVGQQKTLIDSATGKITSVEVKANTLEKNLSGLTQTVTDTKKVIENNKTVLESKNAELKANIDSVSSSLSSVSSTVDKNNKTLVAKTNTLEQNLSGLSQTVANNKTVIDGKITSVESETHELKSGLGGLTSKLDTLKSTTDGINKTVSNQGSVINQLKDSINLKVDSSTFTQSTQTINNNINRAKEQAIIGARSIPDTRSNNENPGWYMQHYAFQTITEFKYANVIGVPNGGSWYGTLETTVPWNNASGGYPTQVFRSNSSPVYQRHGTDLNTWSSWEQIENTQGSQAKADGALSNAKSYSDSKKQEAIKVAENLALEKSNLAKKYAEDVAIAKANLAKAEAIANADGKISAEEKKRIQQAQENLNTAISKADKAKQDAIDEANRVAELKKQEAINSANSHADSKANEALNNAKAFVNAEITTVNSHLNKATAEINVLKKQIELKVGQSDVDKSIEDVKFGGRNLWLNTAFLNGTNHFGFYGCENINVINIENEDYKAVEFVSNNLNGGIYQRNGGNNQKIIPFEKGENLIISGYFKCSSTAKLRISLEGSSYGKSFTPKASNEWTYFELKAVGDGIVHTFTLYGSNNNKYTIRQIKVEKGTKATDWTKAPEDTDQLIVDNIKTVTDKITTVESKFTQENNSIKASVQDLNSTTQSITTNVSNINRDLTSKINSNLDAAKSFARDIATNKANTAKQEAINSANSHADSKANEALNNAKGYINTEINVVNTKVHNVESNIDILKNKIALKVEQSDIDKTKTELINKINVVDNLANNAKDLASAMSLGKMLFSDPTFKNSSNNIKTYNNNGNGTVTTSRISKINGCPTDSQYCIEVKTVGSASPNYGGFYFGNMTRANAIFVTKIIAKIPVGLRIGWYSNATGNNGSSKWLTSVNGTGKWEEYIHLLKCGDAGNFSSTSFFALDGGITPSTSNPIVWHLAYATVFDITENDESVNVLKTEMSTAKNKVATIETNLDGITQRVSATESKTQTLESNLNGKASKQEVSNVSSKVVSLETNLNGITNRVSNTESRINTLDGKVASAVTNQQFTEFKQSNDKFKFTVEQRSSVSNILPNGSFFGGDRGWLHDGVEFWYGAYSGYGFKGRMTGAIKNRTSYNNPERFLQTHKAYKVKKNTTYTISFHYACEMNIHSMEAYVVLSDTEHGDYAQPIRILEKPGGTQSDPNNEIPFTYKFNTGNHEWVWLRFDHNGMKSGVNWDEFCWIYVSEVGIYEGDVGAVKWTPKGGEVYSANYQMDGLGFKGTFEDGTYASLGKDGLEWYNAGTGHAYHALTYVTSFDIPVGNPGKAYIKLPAEFTKRRSSLKWTVALRGYYYSTSGNFFPFHVHCTGARDYIENGLVVCEVQGLCKIQNGSNSGDVQFRPLTAMLIAIA